MQQNREALHEAGGPESRNVRRRTDLGSGVLAIAGLSSLALAQPTYDLLRRTPEFFAARNLSIGHILALVALLAIGPTLALSAPAVVAWLLRPAWSRPAVAVAAGLLAGLIALQAAHDLPAPAATSFALAACALAVWSYCRFPAARVLALLLSAATLVAPAILILDSKVRRSVASTHTALPTDGTGARTPIVLVVFDEWSVTSILDAEGRIDQHRFPNLARFADRATWYPNATAASNMTTHALPSMLTGSAPKRGRLPIASDHPVNLFTLLAPSHDIFALEAVTSLCPQDLNFWYGQRPSFVRSFSLLISDLSLVWLHLTLPAAWANNLPPVADTWSCFNCGGSPSTGPTPTDQQLARAQPHRQNAERVTNFRRFVDSIGPPGDRPALYFMHTLLPHGAWEYLPSGRRYPRAKFRGRINGTWTTDPWMVRYHWKRHLLQVQFVDRLVGELTAKLESLGLFDQSLIVIAADHGVSFRPGRPHRTPDPADPSGDQVLDLVAVPLIIKKPYQDQPEINDAPISLVDLTPHMLELAGADPPLAPRRAANGAKPLLLGKQRGDVEIPADRGPWRRRRLAEQVELLGVANDPTAIGAAPELHGRPISELTVRSGEFRARLESADILDDIDLKATTLPATVEASFVEPEPPMTRPVIVALNGTVADSVRPYRGRRGRMRIEAILPETLFRSGRNHVELFLVAERGGAVELERLLAPRVSTFQEDQEHAYEAKYGSGGGLAALLRRVVDEPAQQPERFPVIASSRQLRGSLDTTVLDRPTAVGDRHHFRLSGTAVDAANPGQPKTVVTVVNGRTATGFTGPGVKESDFILQVAADREQVEREGILVFAVGHRGVATRLGFSYDELERERGGREIMPISDGRRLVVQPTGNGFDGAVDSVVAVAKRSQVHGWAADLERGEPPRQIVVYRDGKFLNTLGRGNRERPDVAEHFDDPRLLRTGFRGEVMDGPLPSVFTQRHRVFAVMQRGVAVELRVLSPPGPGG